MSMKTEDWIEFCKNKMHGHERLLFRYSNLKKETSNASAKAPWGDSLDDLIKRETIAIENWKAAIELAERVGHEERLREQKGENGNERF